ncbi:hypothetical protein E4U21_007796, partial [Claviceps maximensis]
MLCYKRAELRYPKGSASPASEPNFYIRRSTLRIRIRLLKVWVGGSEAPPRTS